MGGRNMRPDVQADYDWGYQFYTVAHEILSDLKVGEIGKPRPSDPERDMKQCTDYELKIGGQDTMIRVRRKGYFERFDDFTFRSSRASGVPTELDKIRDGYGDYALFIWDVHKQSVYHRLLSINDARDAGIFDKDWAEIPNPNGTTSFIAIPYCVLEPFIIREGYWPK